MKKWLIAALLIFFAILIAVTAFLLVRFLSLYGEAQTDGAATGERGSAAPSDASGNAEQGSDIVRYAKEHWSGYDDITFDPASGVLTLSKKTAMDFDAACAYGGSVYEGALAPETYRQTAQMIALDVGTQFQHSSLSVTLCYLSADGTPIFTVDSGGSVWTCWETKEP